MAVYIDLLERYCGLDGARLLDHFTGGREGRRLCRGLVREGDRPGGLTAVSRPGWSGGFTPEPRFNHRGTEKDQGFGLKRATPPLVSRHTLTTRCFRALSVPLCLCGEEFGLTMIDFNKSWWCW